MLIKNATFEDTASVYKPAEQRMLSNRPQSPEAGGSQANPARMSEWVVLDITAMTKSTTREKVLKVLKAGGMTVCKVTDPYMNEARSGFVYS